MAPESISSVAKTAIKNPALQGRTTGAVKIVAGGTQSSAIAVGATFRNESESVRATVGDAVKNISAKPVTNNVPEDYDDDEEMLMYDDANEGDNGYEYDDDEYY